MMEIINNKVIWGAVSADGLIDKYGSPLYFYDAEKIRANYQRVKEAFTYPNTAIYYACRANSNISLLRLLRKEGAHALVTSPGEIYGALKAGFSPFQLLYSGVNVTDSEMNFSMDKNVPIVVDSLSMLDRFGKKHKGGELILKINVGNSYELANGFMAGGTASKLGISIERVEEVLKICDEYKLKIIGLQNNIGHLVAENEVYLSVLDSMLDFSNRFDSVTMIDIGGGFSFDTYADNFDIASLGESVSQRLLNYSEKKEKNVTLAIEPGLVIMEDAGYFLARVNTIKKEPKIIFAGVNAGFYQFPLPLHGARKRAIINGTNPNGQPQEYVIAGNLAEAEDIFTRENNKLGSDTVAEIRENDVLIFKNSGAYCFSRAGRFCLRPLPAEVLLENNRDKLVRKRDTYEDLFSSQIY